MAKRSRSASYDLAPPPLKATRAASKATESATVTMPADAGPAPALEVSGEPDVVQAVRCILAGKQPPDWLYRFRTDPRDDYPALFLHPQDLVDSCNSPVAFIGVPELDLEKVMALPEDQPLPDARTAQVQARAYQDAMAETVRFLVSITKENHGLGSAMSTSSRFLARMGVTAHQELAALLAGWERCQGERWRAPVQPPPERPREEPSLFDRIDRLFLDLAGRLGLHPTELAELRYGCGYSDNIEARLRENLGREPGLTLAEQLEARGLLSLSERAWLNRGELATRMEIASLALEPLEKSTWLADNKLHGPVSAEQFVGRGREWAACADELAKRPIPPEKLFELDTSGDAASATFDELDRRLVDMAGRLGVHPSELAALRFGDTGSAISPEQAEKNLRANLAGEGTLGQLAQQHDLLSDREAAWLDRRERPTAVHLRSSHGGSMVWPADENRPHEVSPLQYIGKDLGRYWEAAADKVARIPTANALDFGP